MKDIFDIKWVLYANLFSKQFFSYFFEFVILFFIVFLISFWIDKLVKYLKKLYAKRIEKMLLKKKYIEIISNLDASDKEFSNKLNYYVRDYFEKAWVIKDPTKKTATELKTWKYKFLDDFFVNCRDLEFDKERNNIKYKEKLQTEATLIIQNNYL